VTRCPDFTGATLQGRRDQLKGFILPSTARNGRRFPRHRPLREISDVMVESAVGCCALPLGVADGFLIDGEDVAVPLAVESHP